MFSMGSFLFSAKEELSQHVAPPLARKERGLGHVPRPRDFHTIGIAVNLKSLPQTATGSFHLHVRVKIQIHYGTSKEKDRYEYLSFSFGARKRT